MMEVLDNCVISLLDVSYVEMLLGVFVLFFFKQKTAYEI